MNHPANVIDLAAERRSRGLADRPSFDDSYAALVLRVPAYASPIAQQFRVAFSEWLTHCRLFPVTPVHWVEVGGVDEFEIRTNCIESDELLQYVICQAHRIACNLRRAQQFTENNNSGE